MFVQHLQESNLVAVPLASSLVFALLDQDAISDYAVYV
jgi:hypothetical protein